MNAARLERRFFRLTALNVAANLTVPLVGLVDTAMLGHLPDLRFLAGVALAAALFDYVYWSLNFLRMSTTGLVAQARGRGDGRGEALTLYRSIALAAGLGACLLALQVPLREVGFALLQMRPEIEPAAGDYFRIRIWGAPAMLASSAFLGWFLGREQSGRALAMTVVANLANIALNYVFIVRMGLAAFGAGLATMLGQYLMLATALGLFAAQRVGVPWRWAEVLSWPHLAALFRLNRDILLRTLSMTAGLAVFTAASSKLGTSTLVVNTILMRVFLAAAYFIDGAAYAVESVAGAFWGAGDRTGLGRLLRLAMTTGLAMAALFVLALELFPRRIYGLLTSHEHVVEAVATTGHWLVPVLLLGAVAFIYDGLFLGLTQGRTLRNAMLLCAFGVFIPLAGVGLWQKENHLLWLAMTGWMASRAVVLGWASRRHLGERAGPGAVAC